MIDSISEDERKRAAGSAVFPIWLQEWKRQSFPMSWSVRTRIALLPISPRLIRALIEKMDVTDGKEKQVYKYDCGFYRRYL